MRKKKIGILPILCLMALTAGVTYAAIVYFVDVSMSLEIIGDYIIAVYDSSAVTPLTDISFGQLSKYEVSSRGLYYIENTGDTEVYLSFSLTGWPADVPIYISVEDEYFSLVADLAPDDTTSVTLSPGIMWSWEINYEVWPTAVVGTYTPTLRWNAYDIP